MRKLGNLSLVLGLVALLGATACAEKPDLGREHRNKAAQHYKNDRLDLALQEYELAAQANPESEKTWKEKAYLHQQVGENQKAAESLIKYVETTKDPKVDKPMLYRVIADEYKKAGQPMEAEKALVKMLETTQPTEEQKGEIYRVLADIMLKSGEWDRADHWYNEALKLNPKDQATLGWIATLYSKRGGTEQPDAAAIPEYLDKAIGYLDQIIALNPDDPNTYVNKRIVMLKYKTHHERQAERAILLGKKSEATEHRKKAAEYDAQFKELTAKFTEANERAKAKKKAG